MRRVGVLFLTCAAFAQAPVSNDEPLRITSRFLQFSVIAEDENGKPVTDLRSDELRPLDNGKEQKIAVFRFDGAAPGAAAGAKSAAPGGVSVLFFDGLNTPFPDQAFARQQVLKFLKTMQPGERIALYVMGRAPRVLLDFSGDREALLRAFEGYKGELPRTLEIPINDPSMTAPAHLNAWMNELSYNLVEYYDQDRALRTTRALEAIARRLERFEGRKALIWVTASFPAWLTRNTLPTKRGLAGRAPEMTADVERAARALTNAGVAVYPVDARGLLAPTTYAPEAASAGDAMGGPAQTLFGTMRSIADRTGGLAVYNDNDLRGAIVRAVEDGRIAYTLGYYPAHTEWNGRFRVIRLTAKRAGVRLRYRNGYFAAPDEPADKGYRYQVLDVAGYSPIDAAALTFKLQAVQNGLVVDVLMDLDAKTLSLEKSGSEWRCDFDVAFLQYGAGDKRLKTDMKTTELRFDEAMYARVMKAGGLRLKEQIDPAPGVTSIKVVARDVKSGGMGSASIPFALRVEVVH